MITRHCFEHKIGSENPKKADPNSEPPSAPASRNQHWCRNRINDKHGEKTSDQYELSEYVFH